MSGLNLSVQQRQRGTTLIEVLVTIVILAFGLLGLAGMQAKIQVAEMESFQRAQAIVLLADMIERINANRSSAADYVTGTGSPLGTNDTQPSSCTALAFGAVRDQCEWSNALKGAAEKHSAANVGAMQGARGCVELIQAANATAGVCTPGTYRVSIVWQGLNPTTASQLACGQNLFGTNDAYRRAISAQVTVGLPACN